jgi:hypothetical protein
VRDAAEEQHRRHVLAVDSHSEMEAQRGAVAGLQGPDRLPASDPLSLRQGRTDRFVARKDATGMSDRQDIAVDDEPDEVHDPVGRRVDETARGDVDAAMPSRILGRWGDEWPHNLMCPTHGPRPARFGRRGGRANVHTANHEADEKRESEHPLIVGKRRPDEARTDKSAHNRPEMRPVGDRCYPFRSIPSNWDDYACPQLRQARRTAGLVKQPVLVKQPRSAHIHSVLLEGPIP